MEETRTRTSLTAVIAACCLFWASLASAAATLNVANNGVDSGGCGVAPSSPCRSISQAITNAAAGDTIVVGPGLYGDLDGNGVLGGTGEEAGPAAAVTISKPLTIVSSHGASSTIIDAALADFGVVIAAASTTFGKVNKGFTVRGADNANIEEPGFQPGIRIGGNIVVGSMDGILVSSDGVVIRDNRATDATNSGINCTGAGASIQGNVVSGNAIGMLLIANDLTLRKNVAVANGIGIQLTLPAPDAGTVVSSNLVSGNTNFGLLEVFDLVPSPGFSGLVAGNDFYGNGDAGVVALNCGFVGFNNTGMTLTISADGNFWGAGAPGANPADYACAAGTGTTTVTFANPAAEEFKVKAKPIR